MKTYKLRFINKKFVNCITRLEAFDVSEAVKVAKSLHGALRVYECGEV